MQKGGIGSHTKPIEGETNTWLTPEWLIKALSTDRGFDLDPCAAPSPRPWDTAKLYYELPQDGLRLPWSGPWCPTCGAVSGTRQVEIKGNVAREFHRCPKCGEGLSLVGLCQPYRVWLNPPYGKETDVWLEKLADHKHGLALIFARTETATWFEQVWPKAHSIFFFEGRLWFHKPDGTRGKSNAGGPSALISYSYFDTCQLELAWENGGIKGKLVRDWVGRAF